MHTHTKYWSLGILLILSACGGSSANDSTEQTCNAADCTEQNINAPIGDQPDQSAPEYGANPKDPPRSTLRFPAFDPEWGLKRSIYDRAVAYYSRARATLPNPRYATLIDFSLHSSKRRLFLFDLSNDTVVKHNVAAGKNSDPDGDGYATKFSNTPGSKMSSLGIYHTYATYNGGNGYSLKLEGMESTNSNALDRAIVMHPANYVNELAASAGRSWGCPAVDPKISRGLIDKIKNGSLFVIGI